MMFKLIATLALFLMASAAEFSSKKSARSLLSRNRDRCKDYGDECSRDSDCCGCLKCSYHGYCAGPCVKRGGYCDYYNYCCEGLYCYGYECVDRLPCYPVHYECDRDSDCCDGLECYEGYCYLPCKREGEFCDDYYHYCCKDYKCVNYCCKREDRDRDDRDRDDRDRD